MPDKTGTPRTSQYGKAFRLGAKTVPTGKANIGSAAPVTELALWAAGIRADINTATDQDYANDWLIKYSSNTAPPPTITPSTQLAQGNFRMMNDFGGTGPNFYALGVTPDPCGLVPNYVLEYIAGGQPSQYNGASSTSPSGKVYQLVEGRIDKTGQTINLTLNNRSTPYIWSVVKFDSSGNPYWSEHAMFPTYSIYVNGVLKETDNQSPVSCFSGSNPKSCFSGQDATYYFTPSQIQ